MRTDQIIEPNKTVFLQTVVVAIGNLKRQLQYNYEQAYPDLREIIHLVLEEEESRAWDLTLFAHLLLPDLVEAHIGRLNLLPADTRQQAVFTPHEFNKIDDQELAYACG